MEKILNKFLMGYLYIHVYIGLVCITSGSIVNDIPLTDSLSGFIRERGV